MPRASKNSESPELGNRLRVNKTTEVDKGAWGMPRLPEAMKDAASCEKLRGLAGTS